MINENEDQQPSHPCADLGDTICQRLEEMGRDRWWLTNLLAKRLGRPAFAYRKIVDNVCSGRKPIPARVRQAWAGALGWPSGAPEHSDFMMQAERAAAAKTKLARPALLRLEAENQALQREVILLRGRLAAQEKLLDLLPGRGSQEVLGPGDGSR